MKSKQTNQKKTMPNWYFYSAIAVLLTGIIIAVIGLSSAPMAPLSESRELLFYAVALVIIPIGMLICCGVNPGLAVVGVFFVLGGVAWFTLMHKIGRSTPEYNTIMFLIGEFLVACAIVALKRGKDRWELPPSTGATNITEMA